MHQTKRQQGVALVVSLVLLVALTIIGVATLSGTRLNEQITSNAQQKSIAFEVAESGISSVLDKNYLLNAITSRAADAGNDPAPVESDPMDTGIDLDFDQVKANRDLNVSGMVTVQYCGETAPIGSSLNADLSGGQMVSILVDINGVATVANTSTTADHVQRVAVTALQTSRTGDCQVR